MIEIKLKSKSKEKYFPCRINNYNKYLNKLRNVLQGNNNLFYEGVKEHPSGMYGILINGTDVQNIRPVQMFYSLRDINFFFFKKLERDQQGIE